MKALISSARRIKLLITISIILMIVAILLTIPIISMAAQPTVNLGTTSSFAILAGSTITNTGSTTISGDAGGDIGLYPGSAFTGQAQVTTTGTVHIDDNVDYGQDRSGNRI